MVLTLTNVEKCYQSNGRTIPVLEDVSLALDRGESASILGPSGSGKTTLLSLSAGLEPPSSGSIRLIGHNFSEMDENAKARLRNQDVGFIFQSFHLMPSLTALENVMLPAELAGIANAKRLAKALLDQVGLGMRMDHYPNQLSGGEQQRVGIARAFMNQPKILFADEPTGNLDGKTSQKISDLIFELNREHQTTLVLITHDEQLAQRTQRIFRLAEGRIFEESQEREVAEPVAISANGGQL